jgi:hypothetical protein
MTVQYGARGTTGEREAGSEVASLCGYAHSYRVVISLSQAPVGVILMAEPERWQVSTDAAEVYESCFVPAIFGGLVVH